MDGGISVSFLYAAMTTVISESNSVLEFRYA